MPVGMDRMLLVDKARGITSSRVVERIRRKLGVETDTFDTEGEVLRWSDSEIAREDLEEVL
jgi:tRNA U55 pseudouridine synthase TruB